jgi:hypothetical protein
MNAHEAKPKMTLSQLPSFLKTRSLAYLWGRLVDKIIVQLLLRAPRTRWLGLSALLFRLAVHRMSHKAPTASGESYRILILSKAIFNEDALATFHGDDGCSLFSIHRQVIKALARPFLPPHIDDNNYVQLEPGDDDRKKAYRAYLVRLLRLVNRRHPFHAVLTANFAYYAEREFAAACEEVGIPFIALHKENIRSPGFAEFNVWLYKTHRGPFTGRRILVYNELERSIEIAANVFPAEKITVTGMSRLDRCHAYRKQLLSVGSSEQPRAQVLFFSFGPKTLLPARIRKMSGPPYKRYRDELPEEWARLGWDQLFTRSHRAMLKLALEHPDIQVTIKTKGVEAERECATILDVLQIDKLPHNLRIAYGGDPLDLIKKSAVVCGLNTTALLESMAAGVPAVVPRFAEYRDAVMSHFVVDFEDAVEYADDENELAARLAEMARAHPSHARELTAAQKRMLDQWLFDADGNAGQRVREAVLAEIRATP